MGTYVDLLKLKPGDLLLTEGQAIGAKMLRVAQAAIHLKADSPYSHASLYLGGGYVYEATTEDGIAIDFKVPSDTRVSRCSGELVIPVDIQKAGYNRLDVFRHPTLFSSAAVWDNALEAVVENYGGEYARAIHFAKLLHSKIAEPKHVQTFIKKLAKPKKAELVTGQLFCSELVINVLAKVGYVLPQGHTPSPLSLSQGKWGFKRVDDVDLEESRLTSIASDGNSDDFFVQSSDWALKQFQAFCEQKPTDSRIYKQSKAISKFVNKTLNQMNDALNDMQAGDVGAQAKYLSTYTSEVKKIGTQKVESVKRSMKMLDALIFVWTRGLAGRL